ncbi:hypothetical protein BKA64DRAFT_644557 [Cadophora sp. MPI-SDFR-AT-0126]|nr:hypothetical protein BKA64DRAFT_644557 [Leotiomycetes sp. MPI-SDFR-AT-0126]
MYQTKDVIKSKTLNSASSEIKPGSYEGIVYPVATLDFKLLPSTISYHFQTYCHLHRIHHYNSHLIHNCNQVEMSIDMPSPSGSATPIASQMSGSPNFMTPKISEESSPRISAGSTSYRSTPRIVTTPAMCAPPSQMSWRQEKSQITRKKADGTFQFIKKAIATLHFEKKATKLMKQMVHDAEGARNAELAEQDLTFNDSQPRRRSSHQAPTITRLRTQGQDQSYNTDEQPRRRSLLLPTFLRCNSQDQAQSHDRLGEDYHFPKWGMKRPRVDASLWIPELHLSKDDLNWDEPGGLKIKGNSAMTILVRSSMVIDKDNFIFRSMTTLSKWPDYRQIAAKEENGDFDVLMNLLQRGRCVWVSRKKGRKSIIDIPLSENLWDARTLVFASHNASDGHNLLGSFCDEVDFLANPDVQEGSPIMVRGRLGGALQELVEICEEKDSIRANLNKKNHSMLAGSDAKGKGKATCFRGCKKRAYTTDCGVGPKKPWYTSLSTFKYKAKGLFTSESESKSEFEFESESEHEESESSPDSDSADDMGNEEPRPLAARLPAPQSWKMHFNHFVECNDPNWTDFKCSRIKAGYPGTFLECHHALFKKCRESSDPNSPFASLYAVEDGFYIEPDKENENVTVGERQSCEDLRKDSTEEIVIDLSPKTSSRKQSRSTRQRERKTSVSATSPTESADCTDFAPSPPESQHDSSVQETNPVLHFEKGAAKQSQDNDPGAIIPTDSPILIRTAAFPESPQDPGC